EVVLLGDEAAAPAIARILEDLRLVGTTARISAYIEVPNAEDQLDIQGPDGAEVHWLIRGDADMGEQLSGRLGWHVQEEDSAPIASDEELLWERRYFQPPGKKLWRRTSLRRVFIIGSPEKVVSLNVCGASWFAISAEIEARWPLWDIGVWGLRCEVERYCKISRICMMRPHALLKVSYYDLVRLICDVCSCSTL